MMTESLRLGKRGHLGGRGPDLGARGPGLGGRAPGFAMEGATRVRQGIYNLLEGME